MKKRYRLDLIALHLAADTDRNTPGDLLLDCEGAGPAELERVGPQAYSASTIDELRPICENLVKSS